MEQSDTLTGWAIDWHDCYQTVLNTLAAKRSSLALTEQSDLRIGLPWLYDEGLARRVVKIQSRSNPEAHWRDISVNGLADRS